MSEASKERLLCRDCNHWFDADMAGEECPICWISGNEENPLPAEPVDPDGWRLDRFGHAVRPKGQVVKVP